VENHIFDQILSGDKSVTSFLLFPVEKLILNKIEVTEFELDTLMIFSHSLARGRHCQSVCPLLHDKQQYIMHAVNLIAVYF